MTLVFVELWPKTRNSQERQDWVWQFKKEAIIKDKAGGTLFCFLYLVRNGGAGFFKSGIRKKMGERSVVEGD